MPGHCHQPGVSCFECGRAMHEAHVMSGDSRPVNERQGVGLGAGGHRRLEGLAPSEAEIHRRVEGVAHRRQMLEHLERCRSRV
jgi:hypothetical protein